MKRHMEADAAERGVLALTAHVFTAGETNCRKVIRLLGEIEAADER
jgi:hypothetical protein